MNLQAPTAWSNGNGGIQCLEGPGVILFGTSRIQIRLVFIKILHQEYPFNFVLNLIGCLPPPQQGKAQFNSFLLSILFLSDIYV